MSPFLSTTTREVPIQPDRAALLFIDVQNYCCHPDGTEVRTCAPEKRATVYEPFIAHLRRHVVPNMQAIQAAARAANVEVMYTNIESLTLDGRDRSLDYKITGFNVPRGAWDAKTIDELAPAGDEMIFPKTSANVFVSTAIDYVLRQMGIAQLIVSGVLTDQCVDATVKSACDLGYLVTVVTDACAAYTVERHENALFAFNGFCREVDTATLVRELSGR
ncbi:cysteine hydrolase [Acuticoccus sp. M5D2P5]|uniref:isochorismatase family cysteine hydrolase n=1 Tax=Acuticoccus kalidii TaxID=2910977 RepID=UPI001F21DFCC|nr:isochorismatase family cysteine hydrolase [Acuticoccus kalidii]MCF3936747.1 cysteine hydrolase [Acuticoccus kalidii]